MIKYLLEMVRGASHLFEKTPNHGALQGICHRVLENGYSVLLFTVDDCWQGRQIWSP